MRINSTIFFVCVLRVINTHTLKNELNKTTQCWVNTTEPFKGHCGGKNSG